MRHAKSNWDVPVADRDRPLAARGIRQAPASGAWLAEQELIPDLVFVSPATRAQQTWELAGPPIMAAARPTALQVHTEERAYTFAGTNLVALLGTVSDDASTVLLVGHNPALEELAYLLTDTFVRIKTATVVVIDFDCNDFLPGQGNVHHVLRPADEGNSKL